MLINFPSLGSDLSFSSHEARAYHFILSLRFDDAAPYLSKKTAGTVYLNNLQESLKIIFSEDADLYSDYKNDFDERYEYIDDLSSSSAYKNFYLAELRLQSAFVHLKMGAEWDAAWDFRKAYKLIEENQEEHPDFLPNYKSLGMLHIMLGSVPSKYQWILHLLGMNGTVEKGIEEINKLAQSNNTFKKEAEAIRCLFKSYLLNEQKEAIEEFKKVYISSSGNLLFGYLYMSLLMKASEGQQALDLYHKLSDLSEGYYTLNILHYSAGEVYLQKGEYKAAENEFKTFIKHNTGKNLLKDSWYKLFLSYWLNGDNTSAKHAYEKAKKTGYTIVEADKHADKSLNSSTYPNQVIMKIRLSTDGGFYERAQLLLKQKAKLTTEEEKAEYTYRKARLYHKIGELETAINHYKETITTAGTQPWYFAPNSCLQLGYIYRQKGNIEAAKKYFEKVLKYNHYEYKTSITNKAKAGLSELKD
ncbi:tetratricopeptide repeat protein [Fulvivirga sediminis]|uniref:Tetratricopeptide repeat protein n=1 Tax=Fulvivirga sediminis TaxID=2803949 RepID=A0A937F407_9BACT|nr:tetratricopeptide repeat protein [Fulvivirga sediminis]MBL3655310.1 tetratricopeptide repeat protein [Fulvivirga sediminis]